MSPEQTRSELRDFEIIHSGLFRNGLAIEQTSKFVFWWAGWEVTLRLYMRIQHDSMTLMSTSHLEWRFARFGPLFKALFLASLVRTPTLLWQGVEVLMFHRCFMTDISLTPDG